MKSTRLFQAAIAFLSLFASTRSSAISFGVTNLVTDDQSANAAQITDAALINAWGVSYSPSSPFWVSANGSGVSTLYNVAPTTNVTSKAGLVVSVPGDGTVTGQAFNSTADFNGDRFLFASEDGTISGWRAALGTSAEVLQVADPGNKYKGTAIGTTGLHSYFYAANFATAKVDVLKGSAFAPDLVANFTDPALPAGFAPFNVQNLGDKLYVTYAVVGTNGDDVAGAGHGIVDAFDLQGNFLARVATAGALDSPWGLAIAPASFGAFAGDLLVGNFGDGKINAYDLTTNTIDGTLADAGSAPLVIDGLWGLIPGNGGMAGDANSIYFSAGPGEESHGLFGVISAVPEPSTSALFGTSLVWLAWTKSRRAS